MNLYQSLIDFVKEIQPVEVILAAYGLLLAATSFIKSDYGLYPVTGAFALSASIAIRVLEGGKLTDVFIMVFIYLALITVLFLLSVRFSKYGWILRMPSSSLSEGVKEIRLKQ